MIRILRDNATGDYVVQTTCLDVDTFIAELAEAITQAMVKEADEVIALGILTNVMPIAFKLAGYKADAVTEQRTLICGKVSATGCDTVVAVGR